MGKFHDQGVNPLRGVHRTPKITADLMHPSWTTNQSNNHHKWLIIVVIMCYNYYEITYNNYITINNIFNNSGYNYYEITYNNYQ